MVKFGNFIFHNRNGIFPIFYLLLFVPSPEIFTNPVTAIILGLSITVIGQLIRIITIGLDYIIRGGQNRRVYADKLVTTGFFAHCRNPLYVGNILILAGLGIASNSLLFNCIATPLFLFFWQAIVIAEENYLSLKFNDEYYDYCKRVNRWAPNFNNIIATLANANFNWKRVIIREYNATYLWMTGAVLIIMKHFYYHDYRFNLQSNISLFIIILLTILALYLLARYLKKTHKLVSD